MVDVSDKELKQNIKNIIATANLDILTIKGVCNQLVLKYGDIIMERKLFISNTVKQIIQEPTYDDSDSESNTSDSNSSEDENENQEITKKKRPRNLLQLSYVLADFMNTEEASRGEVVKQLWDYIKKNNLQNPKDKRQILLDDTLQQIFKRKKVTMFSMNKYLTPHMKKLEDMVSQDTTIVNKKKKKSPSTKKKKSPSTTKSKTKTKPKSKSKTKDKTNDKNPKKKRAPRIFQLSPELATFMKNEKASRGDVLNTIWNHIREHNLQNPKDKREIFPDDKMRPIFNVNSMTMFTLNKYLAPHLQSIIKKSEAENKSTKRKHSLTSKTSSTLTSTSADSNKVKKKVRKK